MPQCVHFAICNGEITGNPEETLCVLHSKNPVKDKDKFTKAFKEQERKAQGGKICDLRYVVFPEYFSFQEVAPFSKRVLFNGATFSAKTT